MAHHQSKKPSLSDLSLLFLYSLILFLFFSLSPKTILRHTPRGGAVAVVRCLFCQAFRH